MFAKRYLCAFLLLSTFSFSYPMDLLLTMTPLVSPFKVLRLLDSWLWSRWSAERPEGQAIVKQNEPVYTARYISTQSDYRKRNIPAPVRDNFGSIGGAASMGHSYTPRGYFSGEERLDPSLVQQVIDQASDRVKLLVLGLKNSGMARRNSRLKRLLLFGPSGSGKTLLAKAIGLAALGEYYLIRTPDILDSWKNCHQNLHAEIDPLIKRKKPLVVILDEMDQLTNQYKNTNSSDSNMPTALWGLLDDCEMKAPYLFFIGTTNNDKSDFPDQIISRFGSNMVHVPCPNSAICKKIICYQLKQEKHNLSAGDIDEIVQQLDGRTGRDIVGIVDEASLLAFQGGGLITSAIINLAIEQNPPALSKDEILADALNISPAQVSELRLLKTLIEQYREVIDYHYKKEGFEQQKLHHNASMVQSASQHTATLGQSDGHQQENHHRQDVDTAVDGMASVLSSGTAGFMTGGPLGAIAGILKGGGSAAAKVYLRKKPTND